jgi:hypothetical protein
VCGVYFRWSVSHALSHRTSANGRKPSKNKYRKYFKHDGTATMVCGVYFRWSVSHALYRLACKLLALSVLASPLREQGPSSRVAYGTPSGVITGPSLGRLVPS